MGTRSGLTVMGLALLIAPLVGAQGVPTPPIEDVPTLVDPGEAVVIEEGPFRFEGTLTEPTLISIADPDGNDAFVYILRADGTARVQAGEEVVIDDATLLAIDGAPTDDVFTLWLRDAEGGRHDITIDRAKLAAGLGELDLVDLPIEVARPPAWPGAPEGDHLLYVQDGRPNRLNAAQLDGTGFLRRSGEHVAIVQMPAVDATYDRIGLDAQRVKSAGIPVQDGAWVAATFQRLSGSGDAAAFLATYSPGAMAGLQEGDTVALRIVYERRFSPLIVERFAEAAAYSYRLDGRGPTVTMDAPAESNDFRVALAWDGADDLTGVGGFAVDVRAFGAATWTRWLDGTADRSAVFSGDWDTTYEFRAYSLDGVGNPSAAATKTVRIQPQPAGNGDVNRAPDARLLTPAPGSVLSGEVAITWMARDPDGTPVTSRLEVSGDDGASWRILYVGTGTQFPWYTTDEMDGAGYRLRLTVSDGTAQASDAASALTIRNVLAAPSATPAPGGQPATLPPSPAGSGTAPATAASPAGPGDEPVEPGKEVPSAGLLLGAVALAGAALLARSKK